MLRSSNALFENAAACECEFENSSKFTDSKDPLFKNGVDPYLSLLVKAWFGFAINLNIINLSMKCFQKHSAATIWVCIYFRYWV